MSVVRILVFGTFDMVHPGHRHFFKQARALARASRPPRPPYLMVSLARDKNVKRIKGKRPAASEKVRLANIKALPEVDQATLGALGDHIPHIVRLKPDIIALGYDQIAYVRGLKTALKKAGISPQIARLKPYRPKIYKTSLIQK
jgi:FAD synthetase